MKIKFANLLLVSTACLIAVPAPAQSAPPSTPPVPTQPKTEAPDLGDIIVTAQKRESRLEKTPMTVNVVSSDQLRMEGVKDVKDLKTTVPGLVMNEAPGGLPGISIRGIGTSSSNQLFEQSVGLFVDGVYHPRQRQYRDALFDVERVEVIKGSQGVLFGKNTSVGAVSLVTRKPGSTDGGYLQVQHELNYGSTDVEGATDLRASDTFGVRIAGVYEDNNGYVTNETLDRKVPYGNRYIIRGVADWDITPEFSALLKVQWGRFNLKGNPYQFVSEQNVPVLESLGVLGGGTDNYVKYDATSGTPPENDRQINFDPSLILTYNLGGDYTITSTTGYSRYSYTNGYDTDSTPTFILFAQFNERFGQFSQEVRLNSPMTGPIDFILGGVFIKSKDQYDYRSYYNGFSSVYGEVSQKVLQNEKTWAAFANVNWKMADRLKLSVGGRFSIDTKDASYGRTLVSDLGHPGNLLDLIAHSSLWQNLDVRHTDHTFDFSGTLSYDLSPRATLYASAGRGNKGAGFNNQAGVIDPYPEPFLVPREVATTYEIGIKGRFLDGRLYGSLAGFILNVKDMQDSYFDPMLPGFRVRSIDAKTRGLESEVQARVVGPLTLYGNLSWLPTAKDADGGRLQRAPKFTYTLGIRGDEDLSAQYHLGGFVNLEHSSSFLHQPPTAPGDNSSHSYNLLNARIELTYKPANISIYVLGTNLTKAVYRTFVFGSPLNLGQVGALNEPRMVTVGARLKF